MAKKGLLILIGISLQSCAALHRDTKQYSLQPTEIFLMEREDIYKKFGSSVGGMANLTEHKVYVPYSEEKDTRGQYLPDFEILGKEIWHMEELGGKYHK